MNTPRQPPRQVPTLTEVVDVNTQRGGEDELDALDNAPTAATLLATRSPATSRRPSASTLVPVMVSEEQLTQRVLLDLQRQVEQVLEQRVREAVEPALVQLAELMVSDTRDQLAMMLRDLVAHAVAQELARHKSP